MSPLPLSSSLGRFAHLPSGLNWNRGKPAVGLTTLEISLPADSPLQRYYDGQEGACGCGTSSGLYSWQTGISSDVYTAAGSDALFGSGSTWCGSGCGTCYNLTSTGSVPSSCSSCGDGGASGESITVMITNLCPNNGNAEWCPVAG